MRSAEALGIDRVVFLGYTDSGMTGWDQNDHDHSFFQADLDEAAGRLAAVLREESADVLTIYDWHGNYGHPDHVKVYQVGCRAEELLAAELPGLRVFEATMNRDEMRRQFAMMREAGDEAFGPEDDFDPDGPMDDGNPMGTPEAELTMVVDVVGVRRAEAGGDRRPTAARSPTRASSCRCPTTCSRSRSVASGSSSTAASQGCSPAGSSTADQLRHGDGSARDAVGSTTMTAG